MLRVSLCQLMACRLLAGRQRTGHASLLLHRSVENQFIPIGRVNVPRRYSRLFNKLINPYKPEHVFGRPCFLYVSPEKRIRIFRNSPSLQHLVTLLEFSPSSRIVLQRFPTSNIYSIYFARHSEPSNEYLFRLKVINLRSMVVPLS